MVAQEFTIELNEQGPPGAQGERGEDGNGIDSIAKTTSSGLVDNYRINFSNGTYFDFSVTNGKSITDISKTGTSGLVDTYTITFNDNTSFSFPVTNGNGVAGVSLLSSVGLNKTYRMTFTDGTYFDFVVSDGASGATEWGGITGVLSNQTDLQAALNNKANTDLSNLTNGLANTICTTAATTVSSATTQAPAVVIENYVNGTEWYRVYSDGWIEQGGYHQFTSTNWEAVYLPKQFSNIDYIIQATNCADTNTIDEVKVANSSNTLKDVFGFKMKCSNSSASAYWQASGY